MRPLLFVLSAICLAAAACRGADRRAPGATAAANTPAARPPDDPTRAADGASLAPPAADTAAAVDSALGVLRGYYAALSARDFARAYAAWASDGPPGHPSLAAFAGGFDGTATTTLTIGTPGRVEGAAGSRYLDVPVTVTATQRDGAVVRYTGHYTLRRSVIPGASEADRRWHLYAARLTRTPAPDR